MKLNKLVIRNFLSVKEADLVLADKGLVSIEGCVEDTTGADSNGAGKSSIMNAILWCNFNDAGKAGVSADGVVNDQAGKDCMVQSLWSETLPASGVTMLYRITRYRKHSKFKNAVTVEFKYGENNWKDNTKAGSKEVQEQICEILGQDILTFKASCFASQEEALDIPGMTDSELKALLERVLPFDDLSELHKKASGRLKAHQDRLYAMYYDLDRVKSKVELLRREGKTAAASMAEWDSNCVKHDADIDKAIESEKDKFVCNAVNPVDFKNIRDEEKRLRKFIESYDPSPYLRLCAEQDAVNRQLGDINREVLSTVTSCSKCKRPFDGLEHSIEVLKDEKFALEEQYCALVKKIIPLENKHNNWTKAKKDLEGITVYFERLKQSDRMNEALQARIDTLKAKKRSGLPNPHEATVKRLKADYDAMKLELVAVEKQIEDLNAETPLLEAVAETYSPKGVRYHILEEITPFLTNKTNHYLNLLTDGYIKATWSTVSRNKSGEYREKFSITTKVIKDREFGLLSGGEKRKVKLACFFALQDLIAKRATKNVEIWCGDEIDHALDTAGLERLMVLLDEKTETKTTILVISHNELREWIPNFATVTRKNDVSTITGFLNG